MAFASCNSASEKKTSKTEQQSANSKQFFEYDAIDYYFTDYDEIENRSVYENRSRSEIDSLKYGVIFDNIPNNIEDLYFMDKLERIGFRKGFVDRSTFSSIDSLFKEKDVRESIALSCVHQYRDILLFKKQNKVVGTAKICFSCMANQIRGTNANTENFGQDGDYKKLERILKK